MAGDLHRGRRSPVAAVRDAPAASARMRGALLGLLLVSAAGCRSGSAPVVADQTAVEAAVMARMGDITRCFEAGAAKGSRLSGETQTLDVEVLATGKVRASFHSQANDKHPVGACVRSALDGLRFQPRGEPARFSVDVSLQERP